MSEIWILSVRTSLPKTCSGARELSVTFDAFDDFEKGKAAFREKIKEFAFSKNAMFDSNGHIKYLSEYIEELNEGSAEEEEDYDGELTGKILSKIQNALKEAFAGNEVKLDIPEGNYTDWMIAVDVSDSMVHFYGDDDGPDNGYDPVLDTNIFSMQQEKNYHLYIDDRFGQGGDTAELYIDLRKATVH